MKQVQTAVLAALSAGILVSGCVSARATMLGKESYGPVPEQDVRIFLEESDVPDTREKYALITAAGDVNSTSKAQMLAAARRRAGKIGANAVLVTETKDPGTGARVANVLLGTKADRKGEMIAYHCAS